MSLVNLGNTHIQKKDLLKVIEFLLQTQKKIREKGNQVSETRTFNSLYTIYTLLDQYVGLEESNMFGMQHGVCVHDVRPYRWT